MKEILQLVLWQQLLLLLPLGGVLIAAAVTDGMYRKVFNKLTYPSFVVGLILHAIVLGPVSALTSGLGGAALILLLGLISMSTGWIRAGDIKLIMVVCATLGLKATGQVFFYATFAGFAMGIIQSIFNGYLFELFRRLWMLIKGYFMMVVYRTKNLAPQLEDDERSLIPFAIAILLGGIATICEYKFGVPGLLTYYAEAFHP